MYPMVKFNDTMHLWLAIAEVVFPAFEGYSVVPYDSQIIRILQSKPSRQHPDLSTNVEFMVLVALPTSGNAPEKGGRQKAYRTMELFLRQLAGSAPGWNRTLQGDRSPASRLFGIVACGQRMWAAELRLADDQQGILANQRVLVVPDGMDDKGWDIAFEHESNVQSFLDEAKIHR